MLRRFLHESKCVHDHLLQKLKTHERAWQVSDDEKCYYFAVSVHEELFAKDLTTTLAEEVKGLAHLSLQTFPILDAHQ